MVLYTIFSYNMSLLLKGEVRNLRWKWARGLYLILCCSQSCWRRSLGTSGRVCCGSCSTLMIWYLLLAEPREILYWWRRLAFVRRVWRARGQGKYREKKGRWTYLWTPANSPAAPQAPLPPPPSPAPPTGFFSVMCFQMFCMPATGPRCHRIVDVGQKLTDMSPSLL